MKETTLVAKQFRIQQWAAEIQECNARPNDMTVHAWCVQHEITTADYYYHLRKVREACLNTVKQDIVAVPANTLEPEKDESKNSIDISAGIFTVRIKSDSSINLLSKVLEVLKNAQ